MLKLRLTRAMPELVALIKSIPGRRWNPAERSWSVPNTPAARRMIESLRSHDPRMQVVAAGSGDAVQKRASGVVAHEHASSSAGSVSPAGGLHDRLVERAEQEMALRRFSFRTRRAYLHHIRAFLEWSQKPADRLAENTVRDWLLERVEHGNVSAAWQSQAISALRFFFRVALEQADALADLPRPRPDRRLPAVLGPADTRALLAATTNRKHTALLVLLYSAGLRVSEVVRLRIEDLDA